MTTPIKTCDYCCSVGVMPTFMNGETVCYDCLRRLPKTLREAWHEITSLRTKIEHMEKQEPVAWQTRTRPAWNDGTWGPWRKCSEEYAEDIKKTPLLHDWLYEARALYALPGAQSVPDVDALAQFIREIDGKHQLGAGALAERIVEWLSAAPEAKP